MIWLVVLFPAHLHGTSQLFTSVGFYAIYQPRDFVTQYDKSHRNLYLVK